MQRERGKRYGHGQWSRDQLFAIVASYWRQGRDADFIARRLGIGRKLCDQIVAYLASEELRQELDADMGSALERDDA